MPEVFLGTESLDAKIGQDTVDSDLRRSLLNEGYRVITKTNRTWRRVSFYAVKPEVEDKGE